MKLTKLAKIVANISTLAFGVMAVGGKIAMDNSGSITAFLGQTTQEKVDSGDEVENIYYFSNYSSIADLQDDAKDATSRITQEGAVLLNSKKERFVNELLPRDVVTKAIREEMEKEGTDHVWLSMEKLGKETIMGHFPNIYQHCLEEGYDVTKECIPVVPAQHYFMGGVWVDSDSKTSMEHLYAVGETSCNGVHGANRLASNSLLESLVFAKRAANKISGTENEVKVRELA